MIIHKKVVVQTNVEFLNTNRRLSSAGKHGTRNPRVLFSNHTPNMCLFTFFSNRQKGCEPKGTAGGLNPSMQIRHLIGT